MRRLALFLLGLAASISVCTDALAITLDDLQLLTGKRVVVGRAILCKPGSLTPDFGHEGQPAEVISFRKNESITPLPNSVLNNVPTSTRDMLEDAYKGGVLLFKFKDGSQLDTCGNQGAKALTSNLELAKGETIATPPAQTSNSALANISANRGEASPQVCPVKVISITSGDSFLHSLLDALTTSELERQMDETIHEGQKKHYLDMDVRNITLKSIKAIEMLAIYSNKMGDQSGTATYISNNDEPIAPGEDYKASAMDRSEWYADGADGVMLAIKRVRFSDDTYWQDDGTHSCNSAGLPPN